MLQLANKKRSKFLIFLFALLNSFLLFGQEVKEEELAAYKAWPRYKDILNSYKANNNCLLWAGKEVVQTEFIEILRLSAALGLNEADYQSAFLRSVNAGEGLKTYSDTVEADIRFTDAALHFFTEVKNGSKTPAFGYDGLTYVPDANDVVLHLKDHLVPGGLKKYLVALQPASKQYAVAMGKLNWLQRTIAVTNFNEEKIVSTKADSTNKPLLLRLYQLGITDSVKHSITKKEVQQYIKFAQAQFDLLSDGVLRSTTLKALNVPIRQRIEELKLSLNTFRWLEGLKQQGPVLLVNIPSATFFVYDSGELVLDSRVIVGKPSTPTPTLTSTITEVVLYPYWTVPNKIAVNELLPSIKRNTGFLAKGSFQVLNRAGKILNPYNINWQSLSKNYFPYIIRQSTGCDNALGLVKFNFYNPFTVYLHDTPGKSLFSSARRFYSHGCMRVEKPEALAHLLLGSNRVAIDTLTAKGCIYQQSPVTVRVEKRLPVVVLYSTVWYTKEGELRFYDDVYKKLNFTGYIAYQP